MTLKQLVNKVMTDKKFYKRLQKDPAAALRSLGPEPTQSQIKALKKINYKYLDGVAKAFADRVT